MSTSTATVAGLPAAPTKLEKKPVKFSNLLLGAGLNMFEVTTLGQPLEVVKTTMAANRADGFGGAIGRIWARGGVLGFYQGLIPWAWIEASTKGAVLLFVASEAEYYAKTFGANNFVAGISGGMVGGLAQAYATMGFCGGGLQAPMSSVYVLEPPTRGKVILNTSCGSLDIELWSKEAPKACRSFVQLCMEGYYNRTIFHRIIPGFIVQGGDPTGTGQGGESIYGEPFEDEIHTRLKFRQRGFVACANANEKNSNSSQFFVTLDRCDGLNGKHTIFGKITGDTIYNLLKLGDCETDKDDRPLEPPRIISTEILWNPFDDIVPRKLKCPEAAPQIQDAQPQVKQKKKLNLLSFGEEALQEEEEVTAVNKKIRSSHDVLNDPRLLKGSETTTSKTRRREEEKTAAEQEERKRQEDEEVRRRKELQTSVRQALAAKQIDDAAKDDDIDEMSFDQRMREEVLEKRKQLGKSSDRPPKAPNRNSKEDEDRDEGEKEEKVEQEEQEEQVEQEEQDNDRIIRDKLVIKKKGLGSEARAELALQRNADMQLLTPLQQQREKYKQRKRNLQGREESTIELLNKFKERLEQDKDLLNHKLEFPMDDKKKRTDDVDHYVVQDPLLERGKEKFNKMQAKMKKRSREWAGRSLT